MTADVAEPSDHDSDPPGRLDHIAVYRWWRIHVIGSVDHAVVVQRIIDESGWSPRYIFLTMMSAGIAVLGVLLSSPAVVIGAMLISPLMSPILGLGFSLALFDFAEMRRALSALIIGASVAIAFTALIVLASPLKTPTAEILSRTRPNLFDLLVALFAALAGTYAIIRGRGETIVGVAIATALMPPLAVIGYGLATWNMAVLGGSATLFVTNLLTIALAATIMARLFGFGHYLSEKQSWAQTAVLLLAFGAMAVPLGLALGQIARETLVATQVRSFLGEQFGANARVSQLDIDFDRVPIEVRAVVIAPRTSSKDSRIVEAELAKKLDQPLKLTLDQVLLAPNAGSIDTQRAELRQASGADAADDAAATAVARLVGMAAGVAPEAVTLDRAHRRAQVSAAALPGATAETYRVLETRAETLANGWHIEIVPPQTKLPPIRFAGSADTLDPAAREAVLLAAWEARRWNIRGLAVPGLAPHATDAKKLPLAQRRADAVATVLRAQGIAVTAAPAAGSTLTLVPAPANPAPASPGPANPAPANPTPTSPAPAKSPR